MLNFDLLLAHPKEFIQGFSYYYPIPGDMLAKYEEKWCWKLISRNTAMPWSGTLLEQFKERWHWTDLGSQSKIVNDRDLFALCFTHWDDTSQRLLFGFGHHNRIAKLEAASYEWVEAFFEELPNLNWEAFSSYVDFPWTTGFIRRHADKWDWERLSYNKGLPWSKALIAEHLDKWDWFGLSFSLPWNIDLIETFQDHINWYRLTGNKKINWDAALLTRFKDKLHWFRISSPSEFEFINYYLPNCSSIRWTPELYEACNDAIINQIAHATKEIREQEDDNEIVLVEENEHWTIKQDGSNWTEAYMKMLIDLSSQFPDKHFINWKLFGADFKQWETWSEEMIDYCLNNIEFSDLTRNPYFPWHQYPQVFEKLANYGKYWNPWDYLSANPGLQLTEAIINQHIDKLEKRNWEKLSGNPSLTPALVKIYEDRWDWKEIFKNEKVLTPEMVAAHPGQWKELWYINIAEGIPFGNYNNFAYLLGIPAEGNIEEWISKDMLEKFLIQL